MVFKEGGIRKGFGMRWLKYFLAILVLPITILVCVYRYPYLSPTTKKKIIIGLLLVYALVVIAQPALEHMEEQAPGTPIEVEDKEIPEGEWLLPDGSCVLNENAELFLQDAASYWLGALLEREDVRFVQEDWRITLRGTTYRVAGTALLNRGKEEPFTIVIEADGKERKLRCRYIRIDDVKYTNIPLVRQKISPEMTQERG